MHRLLLLFLVVIGTVARQVGCIATNSSQIEVLELILAELPALGELDTGAWTPSSILNACNIPIWGVINCDSEGWISRLYWLNKMIGTMPASMGQMTHLTVLIVDTALNGTFRAEWGNLERLAEFTMEDNAISGQIPVEWSGMKSITRFHLTGDGSVMNATIPLWIEDEWPNLKELRWANMPSIGVGPDYSPLGPLPKPLLPIELASLTGLTKLHLSDLGYAGAIPNGLALLPNLATFFLARCPSLSGSFPSDWSGTKLTSFLIDQLPGVSGSLPNSFPPSLSSLTIFGTPFTGQIPPSLLDLPNVTIFQLGTTNVEGQIPWESFSSTKPVHIAFTYNYNLAGTISDYVFTDLQVTTLSMTYTPVGGPFPSDFPPGLPLVNLWLSATNIYGTIPANIVKLTQLTSLRLAYTEMSGPVPSQLLSMTTLQDLSLDYSHFNGTILGEDWSAMVNLNSLVMQNNHFSGTISSTIIDLANLPSGLRSIYLKGNDLDICGNPLVNATNNITVPMMACQLAPQSSPQCGCPDTWTRCLGSYIMSPYCCPLPAPLPAATFTCTPNEEWHMSSDSTVSTPSVIIGTPVTIQGTLNVETITFDGIGGQLNITGCISVTSSINIELTPQQLQSIIDSSDGTNLELLSSIGGCPIDGLSSIPIMLLGSNSVGNGCEKVSVSGSSTPSSLTAVFTIDRSECDQSNPNPKSKSGNTWWIILASVLGGIILIVGIIALVFTLNPRARRVIRPFSKKSSA